MVGQAGFCTNRGAGNRALGPPLGTGFQPAGLAGKRVRGHDWPPHKLLQESRPWENYVALGFSLPRALARHSLDIIPTYC